MSTVRVTRIRSSYRYDTVILYLYVHYNAGCVALRCVTVQRNASGANELSCRLRVGITRHRSTVTGWMTIIATDRKKTDTGYLYCRHICLQKNYVSY